MEYRDNGSFMVNSPATGELSPSNCRTTRKQAARSPLTARWRQASQKFVKAPTAKTFHSRRTWRSESRESLRKKGGWNPTASFASLICHSFNTYEMLFGTAGRKAAPHHARMVDAFTTRLPAILPWEAGAAEQATRIKQDLAAKGTPIGSNDIMIAGQARSASCVLMTNNVREFVRVEGLHVEDWAASGRGACIDEIGPSCNTC